MSDRSECMVGMATYEAVVAQLEDAKAAVGRLVAREAQLERELGEARSGTCDGSIERSHKESSQEAIHALWDYNPTITYESPAQVIRWLRERAEKAEADAERILHSEEAIIQSCQEKCAQIAALTKELDAERRMREEAEEATDRAIDLCDERTLERDAHAKEAEALREALRQVKEVLGTGKCEVCTGCSQEGQEAVGIIVAALGASSAPTLAELGGLSLNPHDCPNCQGRGEIPVYGRVGDGILYYKFCPECKGTARKSKARATGDALGASSAAGEPLLKPGELHPYISTACMHALHDRCRQTCKFCGAPCQCSCHAAGEES